MIYRQPHSIYKVYFDIIFLKYSLENPFYIYIYICLLNSKKIADKKAFLNNVKINKRIRITIK